MTEPTAGGLPQDAMTRLSELQPGKPGSIFTSDLTVNEFLLVKQAGFTPVGMVLGSSIYHVGIQVGRWSQNQELDVLVAGDVPRTRARHEPHGTRSQRARCRWHRRRPA